MKFICCSSFAVVCSALIACGGNKNAAPVTEPVQKAAPAQEKPLSLENPVDRYSYALGMDLGKAIANINVPVKMDVLMAAIQDEVDSSRKTLMTDSASEIALQDLLLQMQKQKEQEEAQAATKALEEQAQFLSKNVQDSTVKVTPKGVQYKIITAAQGMSPKASDKVKVHYVGSLLNGSEFDNSVKRGEPLEFPVNAVIEGWQDLLQVMHEGEKVKAWIPSALAYGEAGVPPMIPANSLLVFEVELLKVYAEVPAMDSAAIVPAAPAVDSAKAVTPADSAKVGEKTAADSAKVDAKAVEPAAPKATPAAGNASTASEKPASEVKAEAKGETKAEAKVDAKAEVKNDGTKKAVKGEAKSAAKAGKTATAEKPATAAKSATAAGKSAAEKPAAKK